MTQLNPLSKREREVLKQLLQGKSNKLIGSALGISDRTVEFHLKNIYAKYQVSSRIELILKPGITPGIPETGKPGSSTVVRMGESAENGDKSNSTLKWISSFGDGFSSSGKELEMKNFLSRQHILAGVIPAFCAGLLWVAMLRRFGHMSLDDIRIWIVPGMLVWTMIGLSVGWMGKRNGNGLQKVCFSTLFATGMSPIAILPLMGFVVLPLGKLAEWIGLIDRAAISSNAATTVASLLMIMIWLALGMTFGIALLFVEIKKPEDNISTRPVIVQRQ